MKPRQESGIALVITLVLLALLVLALYALSALGKVGGEIASSAVYQTQARQNALLGLGAALGELQRYAGEDDVLTGMAGISGVAAGSGHPARHWCGVWDGNGQFFRWLASGETGAVIPALNGSDSVALLATGALGADATDKEHVRTLLVPVTFTTRDGASVRQGSYGWWVGDEGVKLSAVVPDSEAPATGGKHALDELITALSPTAPGLLRVESYAQLMYVPATPLTPGQLQSNLHVLGRTHYGWSGSLRLAGLLNVNSTSARYWRGIAATYNRLKPAAAPALATAGFANWMRDHFPEADPGTGKAANGPFASVDLFLNSALLTQALDAGGGSLAAFGDTMRPWLCVRSDTFRIRAYGEAINPADAGRVESSAFCEAIVQRVKAQPTDTSGHFVVDSFRWLGPDDI